MGESGEEPALMSHVREVQIPFESRVLNALLSVPPAWDRRPPLALAVTHGAGGDASLPQLRALAQSLLSAGVPCLRFTCRGGPLAYRVRAYRAVLEYLRNSGELRLGGCVLAGRSMGARAAAALCREEWDQHGGPGTPFVRGLVCLSFPLHRPGHGGVVRGAELSALRRGPVLLVSGTRDEMCDQARQPARPHHSSSLLATPHHSSPEEVDLLRATLARVEAPVSVHWVRDARHSLEARGRDPAAVLREASDAVVRWVRALPPLAPEAPGSGAR
uniref:Testis-expressed protein 30 n=1 Tax=Petromyzon marinus TaxID=7757 RepID=A0AAJ7X4X7_PETMA|nr:testis-expressed protein 30 [Petromyzon marinus]